MIALVSKWKKLLGLRFPTSPQWNLCSASVFKFAACNKQFDGHENG